MGERQGGVGQKQIAWYGGRWVKGKGGGAETNSLVWWKVGERQGGGVGQKQLAWYGGRWVKGKGVGQKQIAWYGGRWVKGKGGCGRNK